MSHPSHQNDARVAQQRQQVGAALLLGAGVLVAIVWRAAVHGLFPHDWWRVW